MDTVRNATPTDPRLMAPFLLCFGLLCAEPLEARSHRAQDTADDPVRGAVFAELDAWRLVHAQRGPSARGHHHARRQTLRPAFGYDRFRLEASDRHPERAGFACLRANGKDAEPSTVLRLDLHPR